MQRIIIFICREFASFRRSDPDFRSTGPNTAFGDACKRIHRYYDSGPDRVHPAGDCAGPAEGPHQRRPHLRVPRVLWLLRTPHHTTKEQYQSIRSYVLRFEFNLQRMTRVLSNFVVLTLSIFIFLSSSFSIFRNYCIIYGLKRERMSFYLFLHS